MSRKIGVISDIGSHPDIQACDEPPSSEDLSLMPRTHAFRPPPESPSESVSHGRSLRSASPGFDAALFLTNRSRYPKIMRCFGLPGAVCPLALETGNCMAELLRVRCAERKTSGSLPFSSR